MALSNISGYVQQQDVFIGAVTVREALRFSADLRLPKSTTPLQRAALVEETLRVLQLHHVAGSLIGDEEVRTSTHM
jgi:ABC-type multidrug transport system ATPase subunit